MATVAPLTSRAVASSVAPKAALGLVYEPARRDLAGEFEEKRALETEREDAVGVSWSLAGVRLGTPPPADEGGEGPDGERRPHLAKGRIPVAQAAARFREAQDRSRWRGQTRSSVKFRVPTGADLTKLWDSHQLSEEVFKDRLSVALTRMFNEFAFRSDEPISDVMKRLFPKPGVFDQAEFEKKVNQKFRFDVYQSVADANAKIDPVDKPGFLKAIDASVDLMKLTEADDKNLTKVFGTKKDRAKKNYGNARKSLATLKGNLDANVTTDYNLDDKEVGLGGWADQGSQHAHFMPQVVKVLNLKASESTIIHEASHLSNADVDDKGYYGNPAFESSPEELKVTNAAHYEEVPRRILGTSRYPDKANPGEFIEFKPGTKASGHTETFEDKAKFSSSEIARRAWDAAVDAHSLIRDVRQKTLAGDVSAFKKHKARLLELSKLMHLTIHEQDPATASVNQIDVVLVEGVAHAILKLPQQIGLEKIPPETETLPPLPSLHPPPIDDSIQGSPGMSGTKFEPAPGLDPSQQTRTRTRTKDEAGTEMVDQAIKDSERITQSVDDDIKLIHWLADHFRKV